MPEKQKEDPLTIMCAECGAMVELHDPRAYILAIHLIESCEKTRDLRPASAE